MEHVYEAEESLLIVEVVVYNNDASILELSKDNYKKVINGTKASSKTCFASAFDCIRGATSITDALHFMNKV